MNLIQQYFNQRGFDTVDTLFFSYIEQWQQWYQGEVKHFHSYEAYNGKQKVRCKRLSLQMAKKVCEDWANLLMNEKVAINISGQKEQQFIDEVLQNNNFIVKANEAQELKAAYGTVAYVPYMKNVSIDNHGAVTGGTGDIHINYITADNIFPLSWENGVIKECAFGSIKKQNNKEYYYLQLHTLQNGFYVIENVLFDDTGNLVTDINSVKGFENIAPMILTKLKQPQFIIDRMNLKKIDEK